jgi:hypothetical protein
VGKTGMSIRDNFVRKASTYISAILCSSIVACFAQAQSRMPTQKDIDAMNALLKKVPTPEQDAEFKKIIDANENKYEYLHAEQEKLGAEIEHATQLPGYLLTKAHVQGATTNHKKLRALYLEHFNAISDWGVRSGRASCTRQAEKMRLYTIRVSDKWLAKVAALPLGTIEDRIIAAQYVGVGGGDESFYPEPEPSGGTRYWVDTELIGLYAVCGGGRGEYVPGTEVRKE